MARSKTRGPRLAIREARLITKELRHIGVPSCTLLDSHGARPELDFA